jgi:hypothetical protein
LVSKPSVTRHFTGHQSGYLSFDDRRCAERADDGIQRSAMITRLRRTARPVIKLCRGRRRTPCRGSYTVTALCPHLDDYDRVRLLGTADRLQAGL